MKPAPAGAFTSVLVPVPEADEAVARWRARYDWSAALGVPAHVTVRGPFLPPAECGRSVSAALRQLFRGCLAFSFSLVRVERVPGCVYLAPEPLEPFAALAHELGTAWPELPRDKRAPGRTGFHLTVARDDPSGDLLDAVRSGLAPRLPISCRAREAWLLAKRDGEAQRLGRFPLGA